MSVSALDRLDRKRDRGFEPSEGRSDPVCGGDAEGYRPGKRSCNEWASAEGILSELLSEDDDDIIKFVGENIDDGIELNEELVSGVMKSLEEEIAGLSQTTTGEDIISSGATPDIEYLSAASDDELGLPPSPPILHDMPVYQNPAGDDCSLFDQNFPTDQIAGAEGEGDNSEELLQIRLAGDCLYGFDENGYGSSVVYVEAEDWFQRTFELLDTYPLC